MSAPILWIFGPAFAAAALFGLQRNIRWTVFLGTVFLAGLAWLAWTLPIDQAIKVGPWSLRMTDTFELLGRRFVLPDFDRPLLVLIYLSVAFWFAGAYAAGVNGLFIPLSLGIVAFFVAALAVEPFLYAALLIELAVLLSAPLLSPPGEPVRPGVLRLVIFLTMAMPFILFTGWMLTGLEAGSTDISLPLRAGVLLGFGFALLLAIFPFHSWIPLLTGQNHPYVAGFVLVMLQTIVLLFGVDFLDRYTWLQSTQSLPEILRLAGVLMVATGGVWCAFQRHLGRMMGYAIMVETGSSLLAIGLGGQSGLGIFTMLFMPRLLGFAVWALSLSVLKGLAGSLDFSAVACLGRRYPVVVGSLILAHLSVAGLPLLAGFPVKLALWDGLARQAPFLGPWVLVGTLGLLVGGFRSLSVLVAGSGWSHARDVRWQSEVFLGLGVLALLAVGTQPQFFLPMMLNLLQSFSHLL